jgi:branched-chain amino acid transport system permease protein
MSGRAILALAALAVLPWVPGVPTYWVSLLNTAGIGAIVAIGIVVLTGVGGMTSFAQASIMGFGAYTTALLAQAGVSPWLGLPAAVLASATAAALIGAVTLRLSGHYLALATIAWSVSLYYLAGNLDLTGRYDGLSGLPAPTLGDVVLNDPRAYAGLIWLAVAAAALGTRNLLDSRAGRAIRALRGGAAAASSFGVALPRARMTAFVYAAALAGLAGWLYAHLQRAVNPTPFGLLPGIEYLLMAVVGGAARIGGAVLGAALVTVLDDRLQTWLPRLIGAQGSFQPIAFGVLMVLVLQAAPEGILPRLFPRPPARARPRPAPRGAALPRRAPPAPGTTVLEARDLRRTFGGLVAVNDLSLVVRAGEIVGLIGPNGAGKSTTFDLLTGVRRPSAGGVAFMGHALAPFSPPSVARHGIARTFQHVKLAPAMSVIENVALGAHVRGRAGPLRALLRADRGEEALLFEEAARQLARVGLLDAADRPARSLALGQQRLVEIARALALDPVLLLLDEPAAGLRLMEKEALAALLRGLRDEGMTVLLVEHDMRFVMGLTDRLLVMDFGHAIAEGAPAAVRADPAVIAAYLGAPAPVAP